MRRNAGHLDSLGTAPLTYQPVGATGGELPEGFHHLRRSQLLGYGQAVFDRAAQDLMTWQVQRRAGLRIDTSADVAAPGVVIISGIGVGPFRLSVPCRVVAVIDEPGAKGFAYGTLAGHPEQGEERFTVTLEADGRVVLHIVAFSRPATWWARAGGPVTAAVQRRVTERYLRALLD